MTSDLKKLLEAPVSQPSMVVLLVVGLCLNFPGSWGQAGSASWLL